MSSNNNQRAIGVFDSGLGGLTVVKELIKKLPHEKIIYYGDTARVPYGTKSPKSIVQFSLENAQILFKRKVKMIVVACNSSSSYALGALRKRYSLPIVGVISPGAQTAARCTKKKRVGVIATSATIASGQYKKEIQSVNNAIRVFDQACPLFVPLVEEGWSKNKIALNVAEQYLTSLKRKDIDTLILGCTHYPLLKSTIRKVMGKNVKLIDSACEVAREVKILLKETSQMNSSKKKAKHTFIISDRPQAFKKIAKSFLGCSMDNIIKA